MSTPILLYGSEVWGCEDMDLMDHFYLKYKQTTPYVMDYGVLGIILLHLKIKARVLNFWYKIISRKNDKNCDTLYQLMHYLHVNDLFHSHWIK